MTPTTTPCNCTCRIDEDRLHRRIGGLQPDAAVLPVKLLQRDVLAADQRDHHLAVIGRLPVFDDDEVAVADVLVDHRIAFDAEHVAVAPADEIFRHGDGLGRGDGLDRQAGGDVAEHGEFDGALADARRHHLDRPAAVPGPADEAFLLEVGEVFVDGRERRQTETSSDFLEARRVAVLLDELLQIVQNLPLALGEWLHGPTLPNKRRKCNDMVQSAVTAARRLRSNTGNDHRSHRDLDITGD